MLELAAVVALFAVGWWWLKKRAPPALEQATSDTSRASTSSPPAPPAHTSRAPLKVPARPAPAAPSALPELDDDRGPLRVLAPTTPSVLPELDDDRGPLRVLAAESRNVPELDNDRGSIIAPASSSPPAAPRPASLPTPTPATPPAPAAATPGPVSLSHDRRQSSGEPPGPAGLYHDRRQSSGTLEGVASDDATDLGFIPELVTTLLEKDKVKRELDKLQFSWRPEHAPTKKARTKAARERLHGVQQHYQAQLARIQSLENATAEQRAKSEAKTKRLLAEVQKALDNVDRLPPDIHEGIAATSTEDLVAQIDAAPPPASEM